HLLVLGAGYIAAELSGVVHGLGTKVSWAYRKERPLRQFDEMLADNLVDIYQEEGMSVYRNSVPSSIEKVATGYQVNFENDKQITADLVLFAGGRKPNVTGFGLENTSVQLGSDGFIKVDKYQNTTAEGIYAIGDVIGKKE